jgi:SAM-dependent methyltransferase
MAWYETWFANQWYADLYAHRDDTEAQQVVRLFHDRTGCQPTAGPVLDLACGAGRHAVHLQQCGWRVVGTDLSPMLLGIAQRRAAGTCNAVEFVRSDMRHLPFRACFAAVVQLFTAFGYFLTDDANECVIREVATVLLPGGWYLLDFLNPEHVRNSLVPESRQMVGSTEVIQQRVIMGDRVEKRIQLRIPGDTQEFRESVRLFSPVEMIAMFERAGLHVMHHIGDYTGGDWHDDSPRSIMIGRKGL